MRCTITFRMALAVLAAFVAVGAATLFTSCSVPYASQNATATTFQSNGQRIYFTAAGASGDRIAHKGGFPMMPKDIACVSCHGPDGKGGTARLVVLPYSVPDITWTNLTGQHAGHSHDHADGSRSQEDAHAAEESIKRAITDGVSMTGKPLRAYMPRWQMSEDDLDDLVAFLATLR